MTAAGPRAVVVTGVSGAGKSAIGSAVAEALGWPFIDADDLHPLSNKAKMAAGLPLGDADRWPWLDLVAETAAAGEAIVACSALRRSYRERLLAGIPAAIFVELDVSRGELERRLAGRSHEFMPPSLLDSQLATLEPLATDEPGARISADQPTADVASTIVDYVRSVL